MWICSKLRWRSALGGRLVSDRIVFIDIVALSKGIEINNDPSVPLAKDVTEFVNESWGNGDLIVIERSEFDLITEIAVTGYGDPRTAAHRRSAFCGQCVQSERQMVEADDHVRIHADSNSIDTAWILPHHSEFAVSWLWFS